MDFDVIIVGARCAGSPTAMLLARKGYRVLLVDRAAFPSDTMSTHYIHQPGVARLARWGLLDRVAALDCPPISKARLDTGSFVLSGSTTPESCDGDAYAPRRALLDKILSDAFRDAELLADAIDEGFSGRQPIGAALAGYERQRNRAVRAMYWFTCYFAAHQQQPGGLRLLDALRGNQAETNRLFRMLPGTTPVTSFFSPAHLLRHLVSGYLAPKVAAQQA